MKIRYIKTMDFIFNEVEILNCESVEELNNKIKENEVIIIKNDGEIEYINSSYIMYFCI